LREAQVDAQRLLEALIVALQKDSALLNADELQAIESGMQSLAELAQGTDPQAITKAVDALNHATETFAARRMDASVKQALAGQNLNSLEL
jgi:molecular chaperone HscA